MSSVARSFIGYLTGLVNTVNTVGVRHSLACGLEYSFTEVGYPFRQQSGRTIPGILMRKCYFRNL